MTTAAPFSPADLCNRHALLYNELDHLAVLASGFGVTHTDDDWYQLYTGLKDWFGGTCGERDGFENFRRRIKCKKTEQVSMLLGIDDVPTLIEIDLVRAVLSRSNKGNQSVLIDGAVRGLEPEMFHRWLVGMLEAAAAHFGTYVQETVRAVCTDPSFSSTFLRHGALFVYAYEFACDFRLALLSSFFAEQEELPVLEKAVNALELDKMFLTGTRSSSQSQNKSCGKGRSRMVNVFEPLRLKMETAGMLGEKLKKAPSKLSFRDLSVTNHRCTMATLGQDKFPELAKKACERAVANGVATDWPTLTDSDRARLLDITAVLRHPQLRDIPVRSNKHDSAPEEFIEKHVTAHLNGVHTPLRVTIAGLNYPPDVGNNRTLFSTNDGNMAWELRKHLIHNDKGTYVPNFVRRCEVFTAKRWNRFWPTVVGETKSVDISIAAALPQFHAHAVAVLRALLLVRGAGAAHLGRIIAGGCVQYFVTYFDIDTRVYHTVGTSKVISLTGWETDDEFRAAAHETLCWEEASAWLAHEQEKILDYFTFLMRASGETDEADDGVMPTWLSLKQWIDFSTLIRTAVGRHSLTIIRVLKASCRSVVMLCHEAGKEVVAKLYAQKPARSLCALIAAKASAPDGVFDALRDFPTALGHVVVYCKVAPPPDVVSLSLEHRVALAIQLQGLLARMHACKVFHGDVHVDNLSWDVSEQQLRLIDFDTARVLDEHDFGRAEWAYRDEEGLKQVQVKLGIVQ